VKETTMRNAAVDDYMRDHWHLWCPPVECGCWDWFMWPGDKADRPERPAGCAATGDHECPCAGSCWNAPESEFEDCPCGCPEYTPETPGVWCPGCGLRLDELSAVEQAAQVAEWAENGGRW
jgi:hypothetical protein